jgi:PfaB family protein
LDDLRGCCQAALEGAGVSPEQVGYIEAFASGTDALDGIEIASLAQAYRLPVQDLGMAIGSAQANTGYLGAAAGLAGLVRAALCLYHRMIPGVPGWSAPKLPALWRNAPFYVPGESRAWFEKSGGPDRRAGVNVIGLNGSCAHLILGEPAGQPARTNRALTRGGFYLFPLAGESVAELLQELEDLQQALIYANDLNDLAAEYYQAARESQSASLAAAITGHNHEEIRREIEYALKAIPATAPGSEWQTPLGSYFTPEPAGRQGGVAMVYPGAFNSYPGVGKDLFRLFPSLHEHAGEIASDMGRVIRERLLYPRSLAAISKEEMVTLEAKLLADPISMLISGTTLAILYTHILRDTFKVRPQAAFGYSLGENSMLYATGVWGQGDAASTRLEESEAFRVRLAGPQQAIREYWGLPPEDNGAGALVNTPLWSNYLVMAAPEKVQAALAKEPRVYLTHINTPRQVVIGGDPQGCKRVLAEVRSSSLQAPFDYALHCDVIHSELEALAELHDWPVENIPDLCMYSASGYGPVQIKQTVQSQRETSRTIAHMLITPLDFPRLVNRVYADGARVFIEAGAGGNCARWIAETLKGRPHLSLSLNRRGTDDYTNLVRTLARLYSHRVPLDLSALYQCLAEKVSL